MEHTSVLTMKGGIIGGLVGGVLFGMMMFMMGMMPMIAMMVGSESVLVGWAVHLLISVITGVAFVVVLGKQVTSLTSAAAFGAGYGVVWWILGALIIMPMILGMGVQFFAMFDQMRMMSLMGHIIFGVVLAVAAFKFSK